MELHHGGIQRRNKAAMKNNDGEDVEIPSDR